MKCMFVNKAVPLWFKRILITGALMMFYFPLTDRAKTEKDKEKNESKISEKRVLEENFGNSLQGRLRTQLWDLLEYPETSKAAQFVAFTSLIFVFLSTITFILDSTLEQDLETFYENDLVMPNEQLKKIIYFIDHLAITFFTFEYMLRLLLSPKKKAFILDQMNLVDLVAIGPFYISLILEGLEDMQIIGKAGKIVRLVRIMRILRIATLLVCKVLFTRFTRPIKILD